MTAPAVAIDLDGALGDTHALWDDWLRSAGTLVDVEPADLPQDRGAAAAQLDRLGAGNWRALLERFAEERIAVYLRREAGTAEALRTLAGRGHRLGVYTDAPDALARLALAQLGADRRVSAVETGAGARERLLGALGGGAVEVRTADELRALAGG